MARMSEVPYVLRTVGPWRFAKRLFREVQEDGVFNMAAAVAFYWLLAIFPFLLFLLTLTPLLPAGARDGMMDEIGAFAYSNLPKQGAATVMTTIDGLFDPSKPRGGMLSFGLLATIWAASNGMTATMTALDACYDVHVSRARNFVVQRGIGILMTLVVVVAVLSIIVLIPIGDLVLNAVDAQIVGHVPGWAAGWSRVVIDLGRYAVGLSLLVLLVSGVYQFGTSIRRRWTLVTPGAVFAVLAVIAVAWGYETYLSSYGGAASYDRTYGALGGVVILLLLFYFYAVVFLIGAEINSEIDFAVLGIQSDGRDALTEPLPTLHRDRELKRFKRAILVNRDCDAATKKPTTAVEIEMTNEVPEKPS